MAVLASVADYRGQAQERLPRSLFDYLNGGSYAERALAANRADLDALKLRQRVLCDVSRLDLSTQVLGESLALPVVLAPCGLAGLYARRGEVQAARAARVAGVPFCLSTVSVCSIEEVRAAVDAPFWFQLYMMRDRGYVAALMERARVAGCRTLVLTVDLPVLADRYRDVRNGLAGQTTARSRVQFALDMLGHAGWLWDVGLRGRPLTFGNLAAAVPGARNIDQFKQWVDAQFDASVTWRDIAWIRARWPGALVVKGIMDPDDAVRAADAGADAIVVSNHGGRQLDSAPSTISVLPRIADGVCGRLELLVDGGIGSGDDIAKALACGARACLVGRAWLAGLAARGGVGVSEVLAILQRELAVTLALLGVRRARDLGRDALCC
ncbi:L-lactate dehydrogenase [Sinimarinibacterium sp. CAU 1509]|uniref:L-lactate dehydrogenase n=1 Tax=Sinimarinibacterium sp. CAU 1509 TaxID=2562283 RepID=UPI0010AD55E1|nr:L-lactate dehydrogenase [Sinimarinibacterium sp. CAU 1509]TJY56272.1 L-lactate dehydrogenase [Sinimarinibacterium sp. CAU 1509]